MTDTNRRGKPYARRQVCARLKDERFRIQKNGTAMKVMESNTAKYALMPRAVARFPSALR